MSPKKPPLKTQKPSRTRGRPDDPPAAIPSTPQNPPAEELVAIVGIGASAGGLRALERFLAYTPADSGLAFLIVQHLDPSHRSEIPQLLGRHTRMSVLLAEDSVRIEPNTVYAIPPNRYLAVRDGRLSLTKPETSRGPRFSIDALFISLAQVYGDRAAGVVLTGTGTDGTLGLRAIKAQGGLAVAQDPATAEFDAMPRSAIASGAVDTVVPVEKIPDVLLGYFRRPPPGEVAPEARLPKPFETLLTMILSRRKVDFRGYKPGTLRRRIDRRMALRRSGSPAEYLRLVEEEPEELDRLFSDLLIQVTSFFREPEVCEYIRQEVAPGLIHEAGPERPLRIWVPGCATGEEAYSIAILFHEAMQSARKNVPMQIFASDLDERALAIGRAGAYPAGIEEHVSPERLLRFFTRQDSRFVVNQQLRESVVFAHHNLLADPPFIRLDLVSCRNVLIYFQPRTQDRLFDTFAFALNPNRFLVLGASETVSGESGLFEQTSRHLRIFRRTQHGHHGHHSANPTGPASMAPQPEHGPEPGSREAIALTIAREVVLERHAHASVLVDRQLQILSLFGPTHRYLMQPPGPITTDFLSWLREGVRTRMRVAIANALNKRERLTLERIRVGGNGEPGTADCIIEPLPAGRDGTGLVLVVFRDRTPAKPRGRGDSSSPEPESLVRQLEYELRIIQDEHRRTVEQLQATNEELRAANEEVLSSNEELQSTNEEMETSKEELQSLNEELSTVNNQLESKVTELELLNDDVTNLLVSTDIPTIFLDRLLRIRRFTPPATRLFRLIGSDVGRPLADIAPMVKDPELLEDASRVLDSLAITEHQVVSLDGDVFLRRIRPYRTSDHRIGGIVVTFVDISDLATAERRTEQARKYAETIVETVREPLVVVDQELRVESVNAAYYRMFHLSPAETIGQPLFSGVGGVQSAELGLHLKRLFGDGAALNDFELRQELPNGGQRTLQVNGRVLPGLERALALVAFHDVTARVEAEQLRRDVLLRIVDIEERERHRLAIEIHDETGQQVAAFLLGLDALRHVSGQDRRAADLIAQLELRARELAKDLVGVTLQLRPTALDAHGLDGALRDFAESLLHDSEIGVDFVTARWGTERLPAPIESALYRVAQEAIINVLKHAGVKQLSIVLERSADMATLIIEDHGSGFDESAQLRPGNQGLVGMRERMALVGGSLTIESAPGQGTTIIARVPLPRNANG